MRGVRRPCTLLAIVGLAACAIPSVSGAASACLARIDQGILPVWARAGFTSPKPSLPHVLGTRGRIVAIIFGYPLVSPPAKERSNKILWVSHAPVKPLSDLRIAAQRWDGTHPVGPPVARSVRGGPGPSIIDLPAAGCWRLTLRWSGRIDTLDLAYAPG